MRTSPTNIGLWMVSVLGAHDFGYLTVDEVVEKLTRTMETIGKLERYEGHLLNWYDIQTLAPLEPRYVSTVDSGNLLGALWSLEQGLEELIQGPVLDEKAFEGLRDTGEMLRQVGEAEGLSGPEDQPFDELLRARQDPPDALLTHSACCGGSGVRSRHCPRRCLSPPSGGGSGLIGPGRCRNRSWLGWSIADRYLAWIEILAEKTEEEIAPLGPEALLAFRRALYHAPSLVDLAHGRIACIRSSK